MASPQQMSLMHQEDYKDKLHSRNISQATMQLQQDNTPGSDQDQDVHDITDCDNILDQTQSNGLNTALTPILTETPTGPKQVPQQPQNTVEIPVIKMCDFEIVDMNNKLNLLMSAINKVNTNFHLKLEALHIHVGDSLKTITPQLSTIEKTCEEMQARIDDLESTTANLPNLHSQVAQLENKIETLSDDIATLKGLTQVQDCDIAHLKTKTVNLTARSMANNIVITGITGDQESETNCKEKVLSLMTETMAMEVASTEIVTAHRLGKKLGAKPRLMVVKCTDVLRQRIFKYTSNLKGKTNSNGDPYFVSPQLPEPLNTQKKEREETLRAIKKANAQIPDNDPRKRVDARITNKTLIINNVP